MDAKSKRLLVQANLGGVPDVVFVNRTRRHVYVAIGDPGVIEVFDADPLRRL